MKEACKKKGNILVITMFVLCFLICFLTCLIDLVYNEYFYCDFLWGIVCWLESVLTDIGFKREVALGLLNSSLGLSITMFTFVLNLVLNFFDRYEHKIFGIPYGELYQNKSGLQKKSYIISLGLPVFIVIAINLELCGTSYMLLLYSYVMVFYNYGSYGRSYNKEKLRGDVVDSLIAYVKKEDFADDQLMEYDAMLDDIRRGIKNQEGWKNAWLLLDDFTERIMSFDNEEAYVLAYHVWDTIFVDDADSNIYVSLVYVQKFIKRIGSSDAKYEDELIILWSLLCGTVLHWQPRIMRRFLKWFSDISNRSESKSLMKEAGMVLLILEYWLRTRSEKLEIDSKYMEMIYEYGRKFFLKEQPYIVFLANLYQKQSEIQDWDPCMEAQILCMDIEYGLNNSILRTELHL